MFKTMVLLLVCFSASAVDLKPFSSQIEAAKSELIEKERAARAKLLDGLKREEKAAQSSGNLDLVLSIKARLAELDGLANPFGEKVENAVESTTVSGSTSELAYAKEVSAASDFVGKKILLVYSILDQKKTVATKAGKIDEALSYEELMLSVKDELDKIKFIQPESKKLAMSVDGTPLASVTISEEMGYVISTFEDGSLSHHNLGNKFQQVPPQLKGLKYTQQTSNKTSPLKITFETNGSIYILVNSSWSGYGNEARLVSKFAKKTALKPISSGSERYEVWIATHWKGKVIETSNHAIVTSEIKK